MLDAQNDYAECDNTVKDFDILTIDFERPM